MKKRNFLVRQLLNFTLIASFVLGINACKKSDDNTDPTPVSTTAVVIGDGTTTGGNFEITGNVSWTADKKYLLKGWVYVKAGATLTIAPGTVIRGDKPSKACLIVEPGARLIAEGTPDKPIVFTSNLPAGSRGYGDWGGLVLVGKAPSNKDAGSKVEGGPRTTFGGNDATANPVNDNSGSLKYVRIEFAGIALSPGNEINGLSLYAVGSGTTIEHVQVSYSGDDSYEWFGGTVNAKYLIAHRGWDDDFDTDNGYAGKVQFGLTTRALFDADQSGSKAFESDNDGSSSTRTPNTAAVFSNITALGPIFTLTDATNSNKPNKISATYIAGAHIRRNSSLSIVNSVIAGFPVGLVIDGSKVAANAQAGTMMFKNNVIAQIPKGSVNGTANSKREFLYMNVEGPGDLTPTSTVAGTADSTNAFGIGVGPMAWFKANGNKTYDTADGLFTDYFSATGVNLNTPNLVPKTGSALLTGASFTGLTGFEAVNYVGGFGDTNWTTGWASFDPQNVDYGDSLK